MSDAISIAHTSAESSPACRNAERAASLANVTRLLAAQLGARPISVYEAGGGSTSYIPLGGLSVSHITLVDIDPRQVDRNDIANETIVGDLQTIELPAESFDLVICYNVIEHLPRLPQALQRLARVVKPGGLIVIGAPVPLSLNGLAARFTPHRVHVWICKHLLKWPDAGKPGCAPFPVAYHRLVHPGRLQAHMKMFGLQPVYFCAYLGSLIEEIARKNPLLGRLLISAANVASRAAFGRLDLLRGDFHLVLRKL
ncbi:MAG: class I SAM-dependent methyltransferase [Methylobacteriaceae bacterium]|nr:class I SAM-dependent methyltransferase [Methylobacteriaceae bacterium]